MFVACLLAAAVSGCRKKEASLFVKFAVEGAEKPEANPLKGWAPWSTSWEEEGFSSTLAFVLVPWRELEPSRGTFAFKDVERDYGLDELSRSHTRWILRVVCDYPGEEYHLDIPEWLYEETGANGTWYDSEYGKGYSPDYEDPAFLAAHGRLLDALGEQYGSDPLLFAVQLGSLGHWGEWHVDEDAGIALFPRQEVTDRYVRQYAEDFPDKKLMLRRPYAIGEELGLGLYNDSFGQEESHREWLSWIENGYVSSENGESLSGMRDFWKTAPSGGEFASGRELWEYAGEAYETTMELMRESHTTFIGPHSFGKKTMEESGLGFFSEQETEEHIREMSREMGYCFSVTGGTVEADPSGGLMVSMIWENSGIAPIYENWPILLRLTDEAGNTVAEEKADGRITEWLPGSHGLSVRLNPSGGGSPDAGGLAPGTYRLQTALLDPATGKPAIRLANEGELSPCLYEIAVFRVDP